jgi:hypothetical protein
MIALRSARGAGLMGKATLSGDIVLSSALFKELIQVERFSLAAREALGHMRLNGGELLRALLIAAD